MNSSDHSTGSTGNRASDAFKVRLFAIQAAVAAGAMAAVSPVASIAIEVAGLDPVSGTQRMMLAKLGVECQMSHRQDARERGPNGAAPRRNPKAKFVRIAADGHVAVVKKTLVPSIASRYGARAVPIVRCIYAAVCAYRSTAAIGFNLIGR